MSANTDVEGERVTSKTRPRFNVPFAGVHDVDDKDAAPSHIPFSLSPEYGTPCDHYSDLVVHECVNNNAVAPSISLDSFDDGFINTEEQRAFCGRLFCEATISVTTFADVTKEARQNENAASPRRLFPRFDVCHQPNSSRHPATEIDPLDNGPRYTCLCLLYLWKRFSQFIRTMLRCMLREFKTKMSPRGRFGKHARDSTRNVACGNRPPAPRYTCFPENL